METDGVEAFQRELDNYMEVRKLPGSGRRESRTEINWKAFSKRSYMHAGLDELLLCCKNRYKEKENCAFILHHQCIKGTVVINFHAVRK